MARTCKHFKRLEVPAEPTSDVCDQCVAIGDTWVHLRWCLECGKVRCCDDSKNTHARKHFEEHGHPLIQSKEPGETWRFCYQHQVVMAR